MILFAHYLHWHPAQVWDLSLGEFCGLADYVDQRHKDDQDAARKSRSR